MKKLYFRNYWIPVFDGDETFTKADVDAAVTTAVEKAQEGLLKPEEIDAKINAAVDPLKQTNQELLLEIDTISKKANMSTDDKKAAEARFETLQNQMLSKEQLAEKDKAKESKANEKSLTEATLRGDKWKKVYTETMIDNAITSAAVEHKGYSTEQFTAILRPITQLVEEVGSDGPTGNYIAEVSFKDKDSAGKDITLKLSTSDAVKRMKEIEKYQNLFAAKGKSGLELFNDKKPGSVDLRELAKDPKAYRKAKKDGLID